MSKKKVFHISLTESPIAPRPQGVDGRWGSRLSFAGVVRNSEDGKVITGIHYSAYRPMAEKVMREIAEEGTDRFPEHDLWMEHRVGFVPEGDPSLYLEISTPHSREGFEISAWYLKQIKTRVPIWKEPVFAAEAEKTGERYESKR